MKRTIVARENPMYLRTLQISELLKKKSFFLFGPRSTGKTTLIKQQLPHAKIYDLLDAEVYTMLLKKPSIIEEMITDNGQVIVIDEIQKLPSLLDEVHRLIEKYKIKFLLTGSSARKLRHGGANLLAGRAWPAHLFPLTFGEIPDFHLETYLTRGGLPQVYASSDAQEELESYVGTYLQEEIRAEALTRNVRSFAEFLDIIALSNGQEINYQNLASDCQVSPDTIRNYLQILEDTMLGFRLPGFTKTKKRKAVSRAKHYLFDIGVCNTLSKKSEIINGSKSFGENFEHFIILEVVAYNSYFRKKEELFYWRSTSQFEVDLIIGNKLAIEIKSTKLINDKHLKGLRILKEERLLQKYLVVSCDREKRVTSDGITIFPWKMFLEELWIGKIF